MSKAILQIGWVYLDHYDSQVLIYNMEESNYRGVDLAGGYCGWFNAGGVMIESSADAAENLRLDTGKVWLPLARGNDE